MTRRATLIKLGAVTSVLLTAAVLEYNTMTQPNVGDTRPYHAVFDTADGISGLQVGNSVEVAGVPVGKVEAVRLVNASKVVVDFTANDSQMLTTSTWASVRYADLLGTRYLGLSQEAKPGDRLDVGSTIPASQTRPALSLTALFNGFRPIFSAITPEQVNSLSSDIIDVLQGQRGRLGSLVAQVAELTSSLADRDGTIKRILTNLSSVVGSVASHDTQLAETVTAMRGITEQLSSDGPAILRSMDAVGNLTGSLSDLLSEVRDRDLPTMIKNLDKTAGTLASNHEKLDGLLGNLDRTVGNLARVSQFGNFVAIYGCNGYANRTIGQPSISASQLVDALALIAGVHNLPGTLSDLLGPLSGLIDPLLDTGVPIPVKFAPGPVGADASSEICR